MRQAAVACTDPQVAPPALPLGKFLDGLPAAVRIERRSLLLDLRSSGRLVPWMGPAIRGITALRYRAAVCQQPLAEWTGRWKHCRGCPYLPTCGYGIAFEPSGPAAPSAIPTAQDPVAPDEAATPSSDAVRRVVIAPSFPAPITARRGQTLTVDVTSIGTEASATVPGIIDALAEAGHRDGLGPDRVRFTIADPRPSADVIVVDPARLPPLGRSDDLVLPHVTIRLAAPLFLRERAARSRSMILDPDFATFVRHAVRIVREFFPAAEANGHEELAATVTRVASDLRPFRQEKASRRTFRRFELEGVIGECSFADVPACFLPWLALAGLLHVGGHRVAGAGGWTVHTEPAPPAASPPTPR